MPRCNGGSCFTRPSKGENIVQSVLILKLQRTGCVCAVANTTQETCVRGGDARIASVGTVCI